MTTRRARRATRWTALLAAVLLAAAAACTPPDTPPSSTAPPAPTGPPLGSAGLHTLAGVPTAGYSDGTGTDVRFTGPRDITTSADGNTVWVTDTLTVRSIDARTGATTTHYTAPVGTRNLGDIDIDAGGRVFFGRLNADYSGTVLRLDVDGTITEIATIASRVGQFPLATTPEGDVLVPSGNGTSVALARVDGDTGAVTLLGTYEQCGVCRYGFELTAIDVDATGTPIVLADSAISQDGWYYQPMLYRGYPSLATARAAYSIQSYAAVAAGPGPALFTNNAGNAVRVLPNETSRYTSYGDYSCTHAWVIAGTCSAGYSDGPNGQLRGVNGVHYDDTSGRIYIADGGNHAIRWAHAPAVPAAPWCTETTYGCAASGLGPAAAGQGLAANIVEGGRDWNADTALKVVALDASNTATRQVQVSLALTDAHFDAGIVWESPASAQTELVLPHSRLRRATFYRWRVVTTTPDGPVASKSLPLYFGEPDGGGRGTGYPFGPNIEGGDPINGFATAGTAGFIARGEGPAGSAKRYLVTARHVVGAPGLHVYTENIMSDGNTITIGAGTVVAATGTNDNEGPDIAAVEIAPWRTARNPLRCRTIDGDTRSVATHILRGTSMTQLAGTPVGSCGQSTGTGTGDVLEGLEVIPPSTYPFARAGIEWHGGDSGGPIWETRADGPYIAGIVNRGAPGVPYGGYTPLNDALEALAPELGQLTPLTGG